MSLHLLSFQISRTNASAFLAAQSTAVHPCEIGLYCKWTSWAAVIADLLLQYSYSCLFFFFCKILSLQFELFIIWHQRINRGEKRLTLLLDFCILSYLCLGLAVWRLPLGRLCLFLSPYFPPFTLLSKLHSEQRHQQPVFPEYGMKTYIYKI